MVYTAKTAWGQIVSKEHGCVQKTWTLKTHQHVNFEFIHFPPFNYEKSFNMEVQLRSIFYLWTLNIEWCQTDQKHKRRARYHKEKNHDFMHCLLN